MRRVDGPRATIGGMRLPGIHLATAVVGGAIDVGRRAERDARAAAGDVTRWVTLTVLDGILASSAADEAVDRVLASHWAERTVVQAVDGEQAHRALAAALESPALERALTQVIDSRLIDDAIARVVDRTIARLPESPALWSLIDEVAQSPAVREAISRQSAGFADELADDVRERSRRADDQLEGAARRLLHWRRNAGSGPLPQSGA
jgi:hypothetical protein